MPDYLNKNGETYTEEELIGYAEDEGLTLEDYMQTKSFEVIEPSTVSDSGDGSSVLLDRLESGDYDYEIDGAPSAVEPTTVESGFPEIEPSIQDRTIQQEIIIPEIDLDASLSSEDFYSILSKEEEVVKEEDLYSVTKTGDEVAHKIPKLDLDADTPVARDEDLLKAWLNTEYFGKGTAQDAIGNTNLTAYQENDPGEGDLRQDFKSNLGELGISRSAYPNLTDSDLDNIFTEVFDSKVRAEKGVISKESQYVAVNDGLKNKVSIEDNVKNLSTLKINTNESRPEAAYAQAVEKLRGELTDQEMIDLTQWRERL